MKLLMTLTGPSCAGKSTLESILARNGFQRSISVTTRAPRAGETNGVEYYFISKDEFQKMWDCGSLIEKIQFGENFYGVSQIELDRLYKLGDKVAVVCEPVGAKQIRKYCADRKDFKLHQVFVDNPEALINERFMRRFGEEFAAAKINGNPYGEQIVLDSYVKRLAIMNGIEREWVAEANGDANPMNYTDPDRIKDSFKYDFLIHEFNESNTSSIVKRLLLVGTNDWSVSNSQNTPVSAPLTKLPRLSIVENKDPSIGGESENLQLYLDPIDSDRIRERIGKEYAKSTDGSIVFTQGAIFKMEGAGETIRGKRYLNFNESNEIVAALNVTVISRQAVVSNIYVRRDCRRQGLATQLINCAKKEHPNLVVDSSMTELGANFFGYENPSFKMSDKENLVKRRATIG